MIGDDQDFDDKAGLETLELFNKADNFNEWLFDQLKSYCKGRILEIGSGLGNISALLISNFDDVHLSDVSPAYYTFLKKKFNGTPGFGGIHQIDLNGVSSEQADNLYGRFDTVISSNVIEHIENDSEAISNCNKFLRKGGQLIILVPAFSFLYNGFDHELGHYRRYTKKELKSIFVNNGFEIVHSRYFNFVGIFGWWLSGAVLKRKRLPAGQLNIYNKLVPVIKLFDLLASRFLGLSVIVVGRKVVDQDK
jgi:2-polyprenyl-3-methyl-5-hydroxy-6-metoxy-1,4-benzoquinol methylase